MDLLLDEDVSSANDAAYGAIRNLGEVSYGNIKNSQKTGTEQIAFGCRIQKDSVSSGRNY